MQVARKVRPFLVLYGQQLCAQALVARFKRAQALGHRIERACQPLHLRWAVLAYAGGVIARADGAEPGRQGLERPQAAPRRPVDQHENQCAEHKHDQHAVAKLGPDLTHLIVRIGAKLDGLAGGDVAADRNKNPGGVHAEEIKKPLRRRVLGREQS